MKFHKALPGIRIIIFATLFLPATLWAADPKIDMYVEGGKLRFGNSECPSDPGLLGCVEVAKGSKNWIFWELKKTDNDNGWDLTAIKLSWSDPGLTDCVVNDFNVDPQTGYANDFQSTGRKGKLRDENDCDRPYEVNYRIYARNRNTGEKADSDPIIRNGGHN